MEGGLSTHMFIYLQGLVVWHVNPWWLISAIISLFQLFFVFFLPAII